MQVEPSYFATSRGAELTRSPLSVARAIHVAAPPEEVFAFVTDFSRIPEWMPLIKSCAVDNSRAQTPGGVGAVRVMQAPVGKPTLETVMALEAPRLLAYSASDESLMGMFTDHLGVVTCEPHPEGGTLVTWLAFGVRGKPPMAWFGGATFEFMIGRSLANLKRLFG